ncbi:MAG: neutral/alkaline ceramidase [Desulfobacterales bacterium]|jgi:neutral ceramidase|nr:neutral/alkaline ceramidase [Desulfobacterales bacterium]
MKFSKWHLFKLFSLAFLFSFSAIFIQTSPSIAAGQFNIGAGIYDITGPAAECGMMGYSMPDQKTEGIQMRLRSRAFVVVDPNNGKRVAFVCAEAGIIPQGVKQGVVKKLLTKYGGLYTDENVAISATHTHSGPGAYSHYALYNLSMLGYDAKHYNTVVDGIYQSIVRAHGNLESGEIRINMGELNDCGWNRSPAAYNNNPASERSQYSSNTDKTMILLRFVSASGADLGAINWFAIHPTSMGNTNKLISGDNKGYASYLFEKAKGTNYAASKTFVAAFAESNAGDVSPNIYWGYPDGVNDYAHMKTIGERQYNRALTLFNNAAVNLNGSVDFRHMHVNMSDQYVSPAYMPGQAYAGNTCTAAIGVSMLAGSTEDGKGIDIPEGITYPYDISLLGQVFPWEFTILPEDQECHQEKPIILPMGRVTPQGIPLTPEILPVQILKIGNLAIIAHPTEITTMAGRRLIETVKSALAGQVDYVVIAALSNAYAGYVATREEYAMQHYEGASTHFGPYTLNAFQEQFAHIATAMKNGYPVTPGPTPRDIANAQILNIPGVIFDDKPLFKSFGSVYSDASASYSRGQTVSVTFWGGHPKNNYQIQNTFLKVEKSTSSGWVAVANDWDPETKYIWKRDGIANSKITIKWDTTGAAPGTYRIRHFGHWKSGWTGAISSYTGTSRTFTVN